MLLSYLDVRHFILSVSLFICLLACQFGCPSVNLFLCLSFCSFRCPSVCVFVSRSVHLSFICSFRCPSVCVFVHLSLDLFVCLSLCPYIYSFVRLHVRLSFHPASRLNSSIFRSNGYVLVTFETDFFKEHWENP
jgi:hypothetical protein